jgi:hypothetical protein
LRDGRTGLAFTPIDFLRRLATLMPPPRSHLTRYHGVLVPSHHSLSRAARGCVGDDSVASRGRSRAVDYRVRLAILVGREPFQPKTRQSTSNGEGGDMVLANDVNTPTDAPERLTWEEICRRYSDPMNGS